MVEKRDGLRLGLSAFVNFNSKSNRRTTVSGRYRYPLHKDPTRTRLVLNNYHVQPHLNYDCIHSYDTWKRRRVRLGHTAHGQITRRRNLPPHLSHVALDQAEVPVILTTSGLVIKFSATP